MPMKRLISSDYVVSRWSGGTTTQLCIAPEGAVYGERNFLWRVSSATVELAASEFTPLPDYCRWITTLNGCITLTHNDGAPVRLLPYDIHEFDGGARTTCLGRCTDFNLMLRKEMCRGSLRHLRISAGDKADIGFTLKPNPLLPHSALLIHCSTGSGTLTSGSASISLSTGESVLAEAKDAASLTLVADEPGDFLVAEILWKESFMQGAHLPG